MSKSNFAKAWRDGRYDVSRKVCGVRVTRDNANRYSSWRGHGFVVERASGGLRWGRSLPNRWQAVVGERRGKCRFTLAEAVREALDMLAGAADAKVTP